MHEAIKVGAIVAVAWAGIAAALCLVIGRGVKLADQLERVIADD